ncbi:hypothetical protein GIB67_031396 [Kingdonia uniflora]|uniref:Sof1-like protein domain-containing protein n=1 Tax=Kingdonia uniflora TaxID=39325 RepID=A0A7J7MBA8_9MAGN|nr:hypothetical protein GIB67_031396 [Kingdonia uniflora]
MECYNQTIQAPYQIPSTGNNGFLRLDIDGGIRIYTWDWLTGLKVNYVFSSEGSECQFHLKCVILIGEQQFLNPTMRTCSLNPSCKAVFFKYLNSSGSNGYCYMPSDVLSMIEYPTMPHNGYNTSSYLKLYLCLATEIFSEKLGRGGFGAVFKGVLKDGTVVVLNEKSHRLLIYEYMSNGIFMKSGSVDEFTRERSNDLQRVFRNFDPNLRPQEKAIEYVRGLNAAKLEKIFARPFVRAMEGHIDAVSCMAKNPNHLKGIFWGSMDVDIRLWDIATRRTVCQFPGHQADESNDNSFKPIVFVSKNGFWDVDHKWEDNHFATAVLILENQIYFAVTASDRSITLYDLRLSSPLRKLIMRTKSNAIAWNPMEPMNFTAANEDCNWYSYDTRKLDEAKCVHKDHVSAVMDIDYSPTGRELLGVLPRERKKLEYEEALINRFKHLPEINRVVRHRYVPKSIFKASALRRTVNETERKKEERRRAHSAPGSMKPVPMRKKRIIQEVE